MTLQIQGWRWQAALFNKLWAGVKCWQRESEMDVACYVHGGLSSSRCTAHALGNLCIKSHMHKAFAIHILICMQQLRHKPELHINALRMWLREEKSTVIRLSSLQNKNYILVFTGCEWWRIRQIVNDDEYSFFCWSFPLKTVQHLMMPWCLVVYANWEWWIFDVLLAEFFVHVQV